MGDRDGSTGTERRSAAALRRYIVAATLVRSADAGAAVTLALVANSDRAGLANGTAVAGILVASLAVPHLLAPLIGQRLDSAGDRRRLLAVAFTLYGVALVSAATSLGHAPVAVSVALVLLAGSCGPLITGGLSSQLSGLAGQEDLAQRRAEGWDAVSYGFSGTIGPASVAGLVALASPVGAAWVLGTGALASAALILGLPPLVGHGRRAVPMRIGAALRLLAVDGPLRRTNAFTLASQLCFGGLTVVVVAFAERLSGDDGNAPVLTTALGLGSLAGALVLTRRPLRGEPELLIRALIVVQAGAFALCAVSPSLPVALVTFALLGILNAPLITATFAARARYAPPNARAQVFVTLVGLKVASGAAGAALAGIVGGVGPRPLMLAATVVLLVAASALTLDRRLTHAA